MLRQALHAETICFNNSCHVIMFGYIEELIIITKERELQWC